MQYAQDMVYMLREMKLEELAMEMAEIGNELREAEAVNTEDCIKRVA